MQRCSYRQNLDGALFLTLSFYYTSICNIDYH